MLVEIHKLMLLRVNNNKFSALPQMSQYSIQMCLFGIFDRCLSALAGVKKPTRVVQAKFGRFVNVLASQLFSALIYSNLAHVMKRALEVIPQINIKMSQEINACSISS